MSDALNLLRKAILAGRGGAISYDASSKTLSLEGASLPADTQVYKSVGNKWYSLLAVWLQWQHQKLSFTDLRQKGAAMGLGLMDTVTITDKAALLSYLSGADAGAGAGGGVGDAGGGGGGGLGAAIASAATAWSSEKHGSAMFGDDGCSPAQLEAMLRAETQLPGRTRATVLQAPGMTHLRDDIYKIIARPSNEGGMARKRGREEGASSVSSASSGSAGPSARGAQPQPQLTPAQIAERFRGTPIIILPASLESLITMYNVQRFLKDGEFVPPALAQANFGDKEKPQRIEIVRIDTRGNQNKFYVMDSVDAFNADGKYHEQWLKVAAVFAAGPRWQFDGWRWGRAAGREHVTAEEIFDRTLGVHLMYEGDLMKPNVSKWNVKVLSVSKDKRYQDAGVAAMFWKALDDVIYNKKPYLLPRGVSNIGSGQKSAALVGTPGAR